MNDNNCRQTRLDYDHVIAIDAGVAKVLDTESGQYVWARIPKRLFVEHRERLQEWRQRADGGRRAGSPPW